MKAKAHLKMILGAIAIFLLVGIATFALLTIFAPRDTAKEKITVATIPSPKEIVEAIRKPETITGLGNTHKEAETPVTGLNDINYTKVSSYMISQPATDYVQYEQKDTKKSENPESIISSIESFLRQKGLSKVETASAKSSVYIVFDSEQTTCQLVNLPKMNTRPAAIALACVTKETITKTYESIDKLLALYTKSSSKQLAPTTIRQEIISEGNKTLTTLNIYGPGDGAISLLFASITDTWEYLGERPLSTGTTENNPTGINRELSDELKAKIADPKYENFLKTYLK